MSPLCLLCSEDSESRQHFVSGCTVLHQVRRPYIAKLKRILTEAQFLSATTTHESFTSLMLDADALMLGLGSSQRALVELLSRELLYSLHLKRSQLLAAKH